MNDWLDHVASHQRKGIGDCRNFVEIRSLSICMNILHKMWGLRMFVVCYYLLSDYAGALVDKRLAIAGYNGVHPIADYVVGGVDTSHVLYAA